MIINWVSNSEYIPDFREIKCYNTVLTYFVKRTLEKRNIVVNLVLDDEKMLKDMPNSDFTILVSGKAHHLLKYHPDSWTTLNAKSKFGVFKLSDGPSRGLWKINKEGTLLQPGCYTGFGCSPSWLYPEQVDIDKKIVFLNLWNHNLNFDKASEEDRCAVEAIELIHKNFPVIVKSINHSFDFTKSLIDLEQTKDEKEKDLRNSYIPWVEIIPHYRQTHVLLDTTGHGVGLNAIESAACGSKLILHPKAVDAQLRSKGGADLLACDFTTWNNPNEIYDILCHVLESDVDYSKNSLNVHKQISWDKFASRLLRGLEYYKQTTEGK